MLTTTVLTRNSLYKYFSHTLLKPLNMQASTFSSIATLALNSGPSDMSDDPGAFEAVVQKELERNKEASMLTRTNLLSK